MREQNSGAADLIRQEDTSVWKVRHDNVGPALELSGNKRAPNFGAVARNGDRQR